MKAIYSEPMTKVMILNVKAAICEKERTVSEPDNTDKQEDMPLF